MAAFFVGKKEIFHFHPKFFLENRNLKTIHRTQRGLKNNNKQTKNENPSKIIDTMLETINLLVDVSRESMRNHIDS